MDMNSSSDDPLTTSELRIVLVRGWRVIAASTLLLGVAAALYGFLMTPVYRVMTVLIPDETGERSSVLNSALGQLGGLAAITGSLGFGGATQTATTEALAVLQSRQFLQEFIEKNSLMPKLFPKDWDREANNWKPSLRKIPTPYMAYKRLSQDIMDVYQDKKTNLVTVVINWTNWMVWSASAMALSRIRAFTMSTSLFAHSAASSRLVQLMTTVTKFVFLSWYTSIMSCDNRLYAM